MNNYSTTIRRRKPVKNYQGRVCGCIVGNVLKKSVKRSRHLLRKYNGFAWDCSILENARKRSVNLIEIYDKENRQTYRTTLSNFLEFGIRFNMGFGDQMVLPLYFWELK